MKNNFLNKLLNFNAEGSPFISLYLNTGPNENGQRDLDTFTRKRFKEELEKFEDGTPERERFEQAVERINTYFEEIPADIKGVAVFASAGPNNYFETYEFIVPFEENDLFVSDRPYVYPLARILEQNPAFAVALADTNRAHIYVFKRGAAIEQEEIQNTKTNRTEVGGWSQKRYQRHIENFHQQHAKEVIEELEKTVREMRLEQVVLAGDDTVIIPLLEKEMSKELAGKVVGTLRLNVNTPEHELLEAAERAVGQDNTLEDKKKIDYMTEHNYEDGVGLTGTGKVLTALLNGQVQELYISSDLENIEYDFKEVLEVLKDYAPGFEGDLPTPRNRAVVIDQLLRLAVDSADTFRFIEDDNLLKNAGGVSAILRYQAKGVSNI